jgi:hypothetical protein
MEDSTSSNTARDLLRHTLATLAYRARKTLAGAPDDFPALRIGPTTRTPIEILAHISDLLDWALCLAKGKHTWHDTVPDSWRIEEDRFFAALARLDEYFASDAPLVWSADRLFQGPIADSLTHVGQLNMLRRLAGSPVQAENYAKAKISAGDVERDPTPRAGE